MSEKTTQQRLEEIPTRDLVSLFVSPTTVSSNINWGPVGGSTIHVAEYHSSPLYKGTPFKKYPKTVVDKLGFAQSVVPGLESLDQLVSPQPGRYVSVKDKEGKFDGYLSSKQLELLYHSKGEPFGELSDEDFATIQDSLRQEHATVKRQGRYEDPTRAALTPPERLEDAPRSMRGHPVFFKDKKPSEELQKWTRQGKNFHRAPDGTIVFSKHAASDPERLRTWIAPHEKLHAILASNDPSINKFYLRELAPHSQDTEETFIEYAVLKDTPVEARQKHRDSIFLHYRMPVIGDPNIWANEELLDETLRNFVSIQINNPERFVTSYPPELSERIRNGDKLAFADYTQQEVEKYKEMARYNDRFFGKRLKKFREAMYSSRYFLDKVKDSPLFPTEFRKDIYEKYWAPNYVTPVGSDTSTEEGLARHFAEGGLVENNLKETSYKGLSSLVEASPDYELSPIGLGSMTQQAQKLAEYGRNGDVYIVHAAEGETVIPMEILDANPQLKALLYGQIEEMGLDPNEFVVGNELNSINPATGLPEFFFKKLFRGVKNAVKKVVGLAKKIAPIALPIAAQAFGIPGLSSIPGVGQYFGAGSIGAAALGGGLGSLIGGQDPLKGALLSGAASGVLGGGLTSDIPFSQAASNFMSAPDFASKAAYLKGNIVPALSPGEAISASVRTVDNNILPPIEAAKGATTDNVNLGLSGTGTHIGAAAGDGEGFTIGKFLKNNWGKIGLGLGAAYLAGAFDPAEQPQLEDLVGANLDEPIKSPQFYDPKWPVFQHSPTVLAADGGFLEEFPRRELLVEGPGTEKSDDIPAMLSDGEFVWNSAAVRGADPTGNNNRYAGASALYDMMRKFEMKGQQQPAQGFV